MTEKEREILKAWLINEEIRLSEEVRTKQAVLRYRRIDMVDCIELGSLMQRYDDFREFARIIERLLNL